MIFQRDNRKVLNDSIRNNNIKTVLGMLRMILEVLMIFLGYVNEYLLDIFNMKQRQQ